MNLVQAYSALEAKIRKAYGGKTEFDEELKNLKMEIDRASVAVEVSEQDIVKLREELVEAQKGKGESTVKANYGEAVELPEVEFVDTMPEKFKAIGEKESKKVEHKSVHRSHKK